MLDITTAKVLAIVIRQVTWVDHALDAHSVYAVMEATNGAGKPVRFHSRIDSHWQESTARECAARWARFYEVNVLPYFQLAEGGQ